MTKAELKAKWGKYCNTDALVDNMMALLTKYHHRNSEIGVCKVLDTYFTRKEPLIQLFEKSDHYIGDMRIVIDIELERTNERDNVQMFCSTFAQRVQATNAILKYTDENGKSQDDYIRTGLTSLHARNLQDVELHRRLDAVSDGRSQFHSDGCTKVSYNDFLTFQRIIENGFYANFHTTVQTFLVDYINSQAIPANFAAGMKTSRAFNRLCAHYGVDKLPDYNKLFAQYADMVSGLKRKLKFFISVHPLDYLTMSFGVNWASCHTIDRENRRGMPNSYTGAYCGGTMSYMLDGTSLITYVHDKIPTSVEEGKIYRNMFHYDENTLVQGRIYPQGNDGLTDLYTEFRGIVQREFAQMLGLSHSAWIKRNRSCSENTASYGVHYRDYLNFDQCNVSYTQEREEARLHIVHIGSTRICPNCGCELDDNYSSSLLSHSCCTEDAYAW